MVAVSLILEEDRWNGEEANRCGSGRVGVLEGRWDRYGRWALMRGKWVGCTLSLCALVGDGAHHVDEEMLNLGHKGDVPAVAVGVVGSKLGKASGVGSVACGGSSVG